MKKLDIYISKSFIKSFLVAMFAFINIFILSQLFRVFRFVADDKMTSEEGVFYIITMLPKIIMNVAPLAVLLGSLMFMSKMASNLEIISLKTSGISFKRIIKYPIIISFFISIIVFGITGYAYPRSEKKMRELRGEVLTTIIPSEKRNGFFRDENNNLYMINYLNIKTGEGKKFQIYEMSEDFQVIERIIFSETGKYNENLGIWELSDVLITNPATGEQQRLNEYSSTEYDDEPERFAPVIVNPKILTNKELREEINKLAKTGEDTGESIVQLANRYSFPFASFVIVLIGLALGSRYVRGAAAMNIVISIFLGYGYYVVQGIFEAYGKNGYINPFIGGWIPNIIFLILGIYFVQKAEY